MASRRKLRRCTLRWERYVNRYTPPHNYFDRPDTMEPPGYWRAYRALNSEELQRRQRRLALPSDDEMPF